MDACRQSASYISNMVDVKICGISDEAAVAAATRHGAAYLGFVFFARSPRHVSPAKAAQLGNDIPSATRKVGLIVDEKNEGIAKVLREFQPDFLQLHGKEPPERVAEIRARFGVPVIKAIAIADRADVAAAQAYESVADMLLFDAKPPKSAPNALPGGNGRAFDWNLLAGVQWRRPWMLSGGLDADNVTDAVRISGAKAVDVSSGVESRPGSKDPAKISLFLERACPL